MTRASLWILAVFLLAPAARGAEEEWPESLAGVQAVVRAAAGDVPYDRVKVRRFGNEIEISVKLANLPRQVRAIQAMRATGGSQTAVADETDVFLATHIVDLFPPNLKEDEDVVLFDLTPSVLLPHNFGFVAFNLGRKTKLKAQIQVRNLNDAKPQLKTRNRKLKMPPESLTVRCVEGMLAGEGFYELFTTLGPYEMLSYFCVGCDKPD